MILILILAIASFFLIYILFKKPRHRLPSSSLLAIRSKLFPIRLIEMPLNKNILTEQYYKKFLNLCPKVPSYNEIVYLLKYKKFVDNPNIYSMCDINEVDQLQELLFNVIDNRIKGSIVETGSWRGGMMMMAKAILNDLEFNPVPRQIYLFDTFKYFPEPTSNKSQKDKNIHAIVDFLFENMHSVDQVKDNFRKFNLLDNNIHFIEGIFEDTIPITNVGDIAILRLDSDYYESTMFVLEHYYKNIVLGGFLISDDYNNHMLGCKDAIHDFRSKYDIKCPIIDSHGGSIYWRVN
jgi:O-methyltransferase